MYKLALMFVSLLFFAANPASAAGTSQVNWVVTQLSGDARVVHPGAQPASLKVNNQLTPGDMLLTGTTGRATLVRGGDYIIVAPRSELRVPSAPQPAGFTRVIQNLGTLLFKVQHTGIPHFAVDTPMLAAVVKGTTFTVVVDEHRSAVQVIQGVVQVSAIDGGMTRMVEGGRTIFINHDHPKMLLDADKPAPPARAPSSTSVTVSAAGDSPLSAISALTGGLVRPDLTPPQPAAIATPIVQTVVASASAPPTSPVTGATTPTPTSTPTVTAPGVAASSGTTTTVTAPATTVSTPTINTTTAAAVPTTTVSTPTVTTTVVTVPTSTVSTPTVTTTTAVTVPTSTVSTPAVTTTAVTVPTSTVSTPTVTTTAVTVPTSTVSTPTVTTTAVAVPTTTISTPTVTVGTNSGPGSMNSGPGSMTSGTSGSSGGLLGGLLNTVGTTVGTVTGGILGH